MIQMGLSSFSQAKMDLLPRNPTGIQVYYIKYIYIYIMNTEYRIYVYLQHIPIHP